jgi:F0F1-type ATP synthase membrane subunit c/vacuolar-type H+-ATPase subunit K
MSENKMNDMFARMARGSKGMGLGAGLLIAAGGLAYGISQSIFTGKYIARKH